MSGEPELLEKLRVAAGRDLPLDVADLLRFAVNEIERLRAVAGAISCGLSVAEIKQALRDKVELARHDHG